MAPSINDNTAMKYARTAGILYLIIIVCGLFSEMFVRSSIIVPGNNSLTAQNILSNSSLYRLSFASDMIMVLCDVGVAILFYLLLRPVSKSLAILAAVLRLGQATIIAINLLNYFTALQVLTIDGIAQPESMAMMFLDMHAKGYLISGVLFSFSCLTLSYLFYKSEYFPRIFGIMLAAAGIGYLVDCGTNFLAPDYSAASELLLLPTAVVTELTLCLWLLLKGIANPKLIPAYS